MVADAKLNQMAADGSYPSSAGISVGMKSLNGTLVEDSFMRVSMMIGGTIGGGSPGYTVMVLDPNNNWTPAPKLTLSAAGQVSGIVYGKAVRLDALNGTSPGTGNNTPRYRLDVNKLNTRPSGK